MRPLEMREMVAVNRIGHSDASFFILFFAAGASCVDELVDMVGVLQLDLITCPEGAGEQPL